MIIILIKNFKVILKSINFNYEIVNFDSKSVMPVIILLVILIMIMRYFGFDDMLFCCIYSDKFY